MASAFDSDNESSSCSEDELEDLDSSSDDDDSSDFLSDSPAPAQRPCKYYNGGGCKDGARCTYAHVCKYFLQGNCRYGNACKLNHCGGKSSSGDKSKKPSFNLTRGPTLTDGRPYQWQLDDGKGWKDIANDHVIEAQFSLPHTKSMKIYNTKYGAVSIDFRRLRVYGKDLKVRRLDDGRTTWCWFCMLKRKWIKYGEKKSTGGGGGGGGSPVSSVEIERQFQSNPNGSFTFKMGSKTAEVRFKDMQQKSQRKSRKVNRRPLFRQKQGLAQATVSFQKLSLGSRPVWQFEGDNGKWHEFKKRAGTSSEASIGSDDIERKFQLNPGDTLSFKVNGHPYRLDLRAKKQINLKTQRTRNIRRVMV